MKKRLLMANVLKVMGLRAGRWHTFVISSTTRGCDTERKRAGVRQEGRRLAKIYLAKADPYEMLSVVLQSKDTGCILYSDSWTNEGYISGNKG